MLFAAVPKTLRVSFLRCCPSKRQAEEVREAQEAADAEEAAECQGLGEILQDLTGSWGLRG